ncbi:MAG: DUF6339 family protein [Cyclobacteriaceae bacterium]
MTENLLYPRLERVEARLLMVQRFGLQLDELYRLSDLSHSRAYPSATGGHPAGRERIAEVRLAIREVAAAAGYPSVLTTRTTQDFDRPCGTALHRTLGIVPADAAEEGVWSFLTLVVVPEIGPWRFPGLAEDRLLGRARNVLRRVWWRAHVLGPDLERAPDGCRPLGEDEFVQIMERPSLGGNRRTAAALRDCLWRAEASGVSVPRSELMRELSRRLLARKAHVLLDALSDPELEELMDDLAAEGAAHLKR